MLSSAISRKSDLDLSQVQVEACPSCGHKGYAIAGNPGKAFDVPLGQNIYRQPDYRIKKCLECDLYYKSDILDREELERYYQEVDFQKWESPLLFPTEKVLLEILLDVKPGSKILDYGCSTGRLLSKLIDRYECYGVELNQEASEIAKRKGLNIISENELQQHQKSFSAIILSDVFEHLLEPIKVLAKLCDSLNEKGLLLLSTGNADARACQKDIANFWYFRTPEHLCMLGRKHADYLSSYLNLKLVRWREVSHYDKDWIVMCRQFIQDFAYWKFHHGNNSFMPAILRRIPLIKKAEFWELPPPYIYTNDHVVLALQK